MARLALLVISLCVLACGTNTNSDLVLNRANVEVKQSRGLCYVNSIPFSGTLVDRSQTGDTLSRENYREGRAHGFWEQFHARAIRKSIRYFADGKKEGLYKEWWPNGNQKFAYHFENGEYNGLLKEWDENGILLRESVYANGYEDGPQRAWYPNGKVRSNYVVRNGRRFGLLGTKNCTNVSDSIFNNL